MKPDPSIRLKADSILARIRGETFPEAAPEAIEVEEEWPWVLGGGAELTTEAPGVDPWSEYLVPNTTVCWRLVFETDWHIGIVKKVTEHHVQITGGHYNTLLAKQMVVVSGIIERRPEDDEEPNGSPS